MQVLFLNSKTAVVKIADRSFVDELPIIEKIADSIGQYGNIISYKLANRGSHIDLIFSLKEDAHSFKQNA